MRRATTRSVISALLVFVSLVLVINSISVSAHEESNVGNISIEQGWENEPPLLGQLNAIEVSVTNGTNNQSITNAFGNLDASIKKGGITKSLEFQPGETAGIYRAEIMPTQLGTYSLVLKGQIGNQNIDIDVPLEDVEDTQRVSFPDATQAASGDDERTTNAIAEQLTTVISDLRAQINNVSSVAQESRKIAEDSIKSSEELRSAADRAYIFGMIGTGLGAAGIAVAVMISKRQENNIRVQ